MSIHTLEFPDRVPDVSQPGVWLVDITPRIAELWLRRNPHNRAFKKRNIVRFSRDMSTGRWQLTGESIQFDRMGDLLDGQNRLRAICDSGATVSMYVVGGLATESQAVMDSGSTRSTADSLIVPRNGRAGYAIEVAGDLAPIARVLLAWESGKMIHAMSAEPSSGMSPASNTEIADFIDARPGLVDIIGIVRPARKQCPMPIGALGAAGYTFSRIDPDATVDFYDRITSLYLDGKGDPIATLIKRVRDEQLQRKRMLNSTALYLQIRAWNAYRDHARIEKYLLGSAAGGWNNLPVPH